MINAITFTLKSPRAMLCTSLTVLLAACGGGSGTDAAQSDTQTLALRAQSSWTRCATEGALCSFTGTKKVRYGLNGTYVYKTATSSIQCSNAVFGDPLVGADKVCDYSSTTATTTSATSAPAPTTSATSAPAPTTSATSAPAPVTSATPFGQDAAAYTLAFSEEFDNGLNANLWNDRIWYESSNATKNFEVSNGSLKIWPQRDASGNYFNRTLDTDGKYYQTYGYFEMEAKLPIGKGAWPAFWLLNHDTSLRPEIDIMEAYSGGGAASYWSDANLHPTAYGTTVWPKGAAYASAGFKMNQTPDLSAGFHKYAVKWEPTKQTFYFDGVPVYTLNVTMPDRMYILLDLWFGSASGTPDGTTPTGVGNSYEVNYVRAWKFK